MSMHAWYTRMCMCMCMSHHGYGTEFKKRDETIGNAILLEISQCFQSCSLEWKIETSNVQLIHVRYPVAFFFSRCNAFVSQDYLSPSAFTNSFISNLFDR